MCGSPKPPPVSEIDSAPRQEPGNHSAPFDSRVASYSARTRLRGGRRRTQAQADQTRDDQTEPNDARGAHGLAKHDNTEYRRAHGAKSTLRRRFQLAGS